MPRFLLVFLLASSSWLALSAPVAAQDDAATEDDTEDEARWRFERARVDFEAGQYQEALDNFERAYELSQHAELLFNIGQCAARLAMDERALEAFQSYLDQMPDAVNREDVEIRIRELRARITAAQTLTEPEGQTESPQEESGSIFSKWWFWAIVGGVIAVGAGVAIGVAVAASGGGGPDPVQGDLGQVLEVLTWR